MLVLAAKPPLYLASPAEQPIHPTRDLAEREVRFDPRFVGLIDPRHFAEVPLALGILSGKQMTP